MIGRIRGVLLEKQAPYILVDVGGVGYELQAPMTTFFALPAIGEVVTLHTHFSVSENAQQLFGFSDKSDRELFRLLIKINGVGPKMAVGIMSIDTDELVGCVMENNLAALVKVPGVGKKTAERLIIEMRDKLKGWDYSPHASVSAGAESIEPAPSRNKIAAEAESALIALGYKPAEASRMVSKAQAEDAESAEVVIRLALKSVLPAGA